MSVPLHPSLPSPPTHSDFMRQEEPPDRSPGPKVRTEFFALETAPPALSSCFSVPALVSGFRICCIAQCGGLLRLPWMARDSRLSVCAHCLCLALLTILWGRLPHPSSFLWISRWCDYVLYQRKRIWTNHTLSSDSLWIDTDQTVENSWSICLKILASWSYSLWSLLHFMKAFVCSFKLHPTLLGFPGGSVGKETACDAGDLEFYPWVWKIPQKRTWQPTPVFLPEESHGQRRLVGCSPWGCKSRTRLGG